MNDGAVISTRTSGGTTIEFPITMGLHQGLTLIPYLFALVVGSLN